MNEPDKTDGRRNETRNKLLAGALRLLSTQGYDRATTGRIAKTAGIRQSSFYRHFDSRDECLATAIRDAGEQLAARLAARRASLVPEEFQKHDPMHREGFMLSLGFLGANRDIAKILLTLRDAENAAGQATREVLARLRDELVADLPKLGVDPVPADAAMRVDMMFALVAQAAAGIRDGEYDLNAVATFLAKQTQHIFS